jgi:hypothetical protein
MTQPKQRSASGHATEVCAPAIQEQLPAGFVENLTGEILAAVGTFRNAEVSGDKDYLRQLHVYAKRKSTEYQGPALQKLFAKHKTHFLPGSKIDPAKIAPKLRLVQDKSRTDMELFRLVRGMWSMPPNKGYGRRLRFIVYDEYHESVIGIIGLQSPPADLSCRDRLFSYPKGEKLQLVNSTMDAFTVGAIPPYSYLLGGKLCAGLISSDEIRQAYWRQYAGEKTWMEDRSIGQPLLGVTTTGAFGRSSMYNRLRYQGRLLAEPIGYTLGYGTLHLEHLYDDISKYLRSTGNFKDGGFGAGPKIRWQNIANALSGLGLSGSLLKHGVQREVFLFRFVSDLEGGMAGKSFGEPIKLPADTFSDYWKERWALPRAARFPTWNQGHDLQILCNALL